MKFLVVLIWQRASKQHRDVAESADRAHHHGRQIGRWVHHRCHLLSRSLTNSEKPGEVASTGSTHSSRGLRLQIFRDVPMQLQSVERRGFLFDGGVHHGAPPAHHVVSEEWEPHDGHGKHRGWLAVPPAAVTGRSKRAARLAVIGLHRSGLGCDGRAWVFATDVSCSQVLHR
jgi:hypothetical protein